MGRPVVSTPYWHAAELLADGRGVLVPFAEPAAIADGGARPARGSGADAGDARERLSAGRGFVWPRIGERYMDVFREARRGHAGAPGIGCAAQDAPARVAAAGTSLVVGQQPERHADRRLAARPLGRAARLAGIAQHAMHAVVDRAHGYCLDDNARGLMLAMLLPGEAGRGAARRRSCSPAPRRSSSMPGTARRGGSATS